MFSVIAGPMNSGNMGIELYYVELEEVLMDSLDGLSIGKYGLGFNRSRERTRRGDGKATGLIDGDILDFVDCYEVWLAGEIGMGAGVAAWGSSAISLCKLLWNSIIGTSLSTSSHTEWVLSTIKLCEQVFPTAFACGLIHVDGSGIAENSSRASGYLCSHSHTEDGYISHYCDMLLDLFEMAFICLFAFDTVCGTVVGSVEQIQCDQGVREADSVPESFEVVSPQMDPLGSKGSSSAVCPIALQYFKSSQGKKNARVSFPLTPVAAPRPSLERWIFSLRDPESLVGMSCELHPEEPMGSEEALRLDLNLTT
ncbi:hypothetical protein Q9966_011312 [Columba livia]|nr:hypothetical protein Q9966_011312 [Columba livia]